MKEITYKEESVTDLLCKELKNRGGMKSKTLFCLVIVAVSELFARYFGNVLIFMGTVMLICHLGGWADTFNICTREFAMFAILDVLFIIAGILWNGYRAIVNKRNRTN